MIFSQTYPIITYALMLTILTIISFFVVLRKKGREKKILLILPTSLQQEIQLSIADGISRSVEIFSSAEKVPLRMYKSCIFVIDPKENLDKQIESFKRIREQAENSIIILISEDLDGVSSLKERLPEVKIFKPSEVEKVGEIIHTQIGKI
jgi:predicted Co/Zn/Cd cation transporter (cation efflux family)